ncbi:hypothetical protein BGZ65_003517 [Modicella reniformis]|uniref:Uncharacterized protein n=1 Tax=Modicella reniformis TaxID=1440133 RepID=A0A9P6LU09_9FUNG|nr:hypothetical protein BGZ65_003517 [Modicella reniformis]
MAAHTKRQVQMMLGTFAKIITESEVEPQDRLLLKPARQLNVTSGQDQDFGADGGTYQQLRDEDFDPREYNERGYALRSSIRCDGFRIQLLVYKIKELNGVRCKRYPESVLPNRLTSVVAGVGDFLTEVRNVLQSDQDIADLWDCNPKEMKILGLDPGQTFAVGAFALLPQDRPISESSENNTKIP